MDIQEKHQIIEKNELIRKSILVSQMQDHPGFAVFMEEMEDLIKAVQFQDVRGIKNTEVLNQSIGYVNFADAMKQYLSGQKIWALQPMDDEVTGEEEILNSNKE